MHRSILHVLLFVLPLLTAVPALAANRYTSREEIQKRLDECDQLIADEHWSEANAILTQARLQAESNKFLDLLFRANIDLAIVYYSIDQTSASMLCSYEALHLAEQEGYDWERRFTALNGIAGGYYRMHEYAKAHEITAQCLEAAHQAADSVAIVDFALNLTRICGKEQLTDSALWYDGIVRQWLPASYHPDICHVMWDVEMEMHYLRGEYPQALALADSLLTHTDSRLGHVTAHFTRFLISHRQGQGLQAVPEALQAAQFASSSRRAEIYDTLAILYQTAHMPLDALRYKDSALYYRQQVQKHIDQQMLEQSQIQIESTRIRYEYEAQQQHLAHSRRLVIGLILLILVILLSVWLFIRHQRHKARRQLNLKDEELHTANLITSSRNEVVSSLIDSLEDITDIQQNEHVKNLIGDLRRQLRDSSSQDDFLIAFKQANPAFVSNIMQRHPDLQPSDLQFLAYLLQNNLSTADIASLLNITPDSCKRKKLRMSRKLGLESSTELYDYLCNFK